jgi:hypothetical protein
MHGQSKMERRHRARRPARSRRNVALATAIAAVSTLSSTAGGGSVSAGMSAAGDVAEWVDEVNPSVTVVDQSTDCMAVPSDAAFYRGDRIVLRPATPMADVDVRTAVNDALNNIYAPRPAEDWATKVERIVFPQPPSGPGIRPVLSVSLKPRSDEEPHEVVELARALSTESNEAGPDYVFTPATPYSAFWPHGDPKPITALTPPRTNVTPDKMPPGTVGSLPIGTGTKIEVYDSGLAPRSPGELPNVATLASVDNELIDIDGDGIADYPAVGHGKAIAGVIATLVPGAIVQEARISDRDGLVTDVSAARRMAESLRNMPRTNWPSVVVNAFSSVACDFNTGAPGRQLEPVGLKAVVEVSDRFDPILPDGLVIVASAGNQDSSRENYPAAFDSVLGVGALDATVDPNGDPWSSPTRTGPKADFSNYGDWVEVWAPGVKLPTNHVSGVAFEKGQPVLNGMAEVYGTSFAGPFVAALIAEQMSMTGVDARTAWEMIEAQGALPLAECGSPPSSAPTGVAVALVSMSSTVTATTPGSGKSEVC